MASEACASNASDRRRYGGAIDAVCGSTTTDQLTPPTEFAGNGVPRLPDGDLLTTRVGTEGGPSKGLSRYRHDSGTVEVSWSPVPRSEGLALAPDQRTVYTDDPASMAHCGAYDLPPTSISRRHGFRRIRL
ncbi:hypothetical protein [Nocardia australiensis]|uniref:hypothetical protein n=1 Tax=Nocardia australiensis TaxID=2887191 RepID=UPI001D15102A|nr:hypothetical protein [Nocardia australiensis]